MTDKKTGIVVFDIDGTLTDSIPQHQIAFENALRSFNFPALRTDWANYLHHTDSAIFVQAWAEAKFTSLSDLAELETRYIRELDQQLAKKPFAEIAGAASFIHWLNEQGWKVVYATGSLRYGAEKKLAALDIDLRDAILVTASEYQIREDLLINAIKQATEKYSLPAGQKIISIGDGVWDLKTAENLDVAFIGIGVGAKAKLLTDLGATVFTDFNELRKQGEHLIH
ncbi:HAD family hydrolase [Rouxiella sp. WC2420]|uniref:phosphoglycolate phosphatase n=1 Tax=Rouxiella sp. WC2420 TaxID=3234145 RepID=A0AB39VUE5_9GAMM